jgi:hypothetical protein
MHAYVVRSDWLDRHLLVGDDFALSALAAREAEVA